MPTLDEPFEIAYWGITIKVTPVINGSETSICITFDFRAAANICRIANKLGGRISISSKLYNKFSVFSLNGRFIKNRNLLKKPLKRRILLRQENNVWKVFTFLQRLIGRIHKTNAIKKGCWMEIHPHYNPTSYEKPSRK